MRWFQALLLIASFAHEQAFNNTNFRNSMLSEHNAVRQRLGLPALQWSNELAETASRWASALAATGQIRHDGDHRHGQNLFAISGGQASPAMVVHSWAEEVQFYDYAHNTCSDVCGHYTQLVWRTTDRVGCAVARRARREVWVCDYEPPGNVVGQRPY